MAQDFPLPPGWQRDVSEELCERIASMMDYHGDVQDVAHLNEVFTPLSFRERIHLLYAYFPQREVLVTSSFGTNSAFLLWLIHQLRPSQTIHFIDTTYHFPETHTYRKELTKLLNLQVTEVFPDTAESAKTLEEKRWKTDPDGCCRINKVNPIAPIKAKHRVWMSGVMGFQTSFRAGLRVFEESDGLLKFHPLVDLSEEDFLREMEAANLPPHPLVKEGFGSVGCTHCTQKGGGRAGRWSGQAKTECGLHPSYFAEKNKHSK